MRLKFSNPVTRHVPPCIQHNRDGPAPKCNVRDILCIVGVGDRLSGDSSASMQSTLHITSFEGEFGSENRIDMEEKRKWY
jgi:hypothetical protein